MSSARAIFGIMNTCKNCKFWGRDFANTCDGETGDISSTVIRGFPPAKVLSVKNPAGFGVYATASDDQGLEARLITGPDFGCVRFQAKEAAQVPAVIPPA